MKTLILLLLVPTIVFTQMHEKIIPDQVDLQFWFDIGPELIPENTSDSFEVSITLTVLIDDFKPRHNSLNNNLPQHLTTFSLSNWHPLETGESNRNHAMDRSITMNDPTSFKQDIFNNTTNENLKWRDPLGIPVGFGPRIRF